jgi:hypothetical protein
MHIKLLKFRVAFEKRLQKPIFNHRKAKRSNAQFENLTTDVINNEESKVTQDSASNNKIPIVSLLIGGGVGSVSLVLTKIYQGIPILIFKGTIHALKSVFFRKLNQIN